MDPEKQFDACFKQAEFFRGLYNSRRDFEWKITLGFWGGILAAISILINYQDKFPELEWWIWLIPAILHAMWLSPMWVAHKNDKIQMFHYQEEAELFLRNKNHVLRHKPIIISFRNSWNWFRFLLDWAMRLEFLTTFALSVLAFIINNNK